MPAQTRASPTRAPATRPAAPPARAPVRYAQPPMAYDQGYAAGLGGAPPVFVQAKPSWARPGTVTGSAVLAFVLAGFCLIAAITWLVARDFDEAFSGGSSSVYLIRGVANIGAAVLFMAGAIASVSRQGWGRLVLMGTAALHAAYCLMRIVEGQYFDLLFVFMDATILVLLAMPQVTRFFTTRDPLMAR